MKVSLVVPLVSLPLLAACSPAVHNTDPLKNINQEEVATQTFLQEKDKSLAKDEDTNPEIDTFSSSSQKVVHREGHSFRAVAENETVQDIKNQGIETGVPQAHVIYNSALVPIPPVVTEQATDKRGVTSEEFKEKFKGKPNLAPSFFSMRYKNGKGEEAKVSAVVSANTSYNAVSSPDDVDLEDISSLYTPVQSEQELKEELTALEKTGDWSDSGEGKTDILSAYGIQCDLPKSFTTTKVKLDLDFLTSIAKGKRSDQPEPSEQLNHPEQAEKEKKPACDFPVIVNKQVEFYLDQFQNRQRVTFKRWMKRASTYLSLIEEELEEAGLPRSLVYLAMIESGFNPAAYSPARAAGLWQFMASTARTYGLRIDSWVDERRDPEKSTRAAVVYLSSLYERFGDWQLAVAAYNAGEGKIQRGLRKYKAKTFWDLAAKKYLPLETKRYVPKLIAAIIIAHDPERYGFQPIQAKDEQYDIVEVPSRTRLSAIAAAGGCSVKKIRQLNTELLKNKVPPTKGKYSIKVPSGSRMRILANLDQARIDQERKIVHRLRKGETLSGIGKRYNVSVNMIMQWNDIDDVRRIRAGRRLALYLDGQPDGGAKKIEEEGSVHYYKVRNGDSLWSIARKHKVSTKEIKRWNRLSSNMLQPGKKLVIRKS